jgi:hypothetical protein
VLTIALVIAASILLFVALARGERNAWNRRSRRIQKRDRVPRSDWYTDLPRLPKDAIDRMLSLIGKVLDVPPDVVRPDDSLHSDLSIVDGFFCMAADDDTIECLCDEIEDELGTRPKGDWSTLRDVVLEFASLRCCRSVFSNTGGSSHRQRICRPSGSESRYSVDLGITTRARARHEPLRLRFACWKS